jgi:hypothetical protein
MATVQPLDNSHGPNNATTDETTQDDKDHSTATSRLVFETVLDLVGYFEDMLRTCIQHHNTRQSQERVKDRQTGDLRFMKLFQTFMPRKEARIMFLDFVSNPKHLPLTQVLFGSPPYMFLELNDGWALRAGGLAIGRINMTYKDELSRICPNSSQFGYALWEDQHRREYSYKDTDQGDTMRGWLPPLLKVQSQLFLQLIVRIPTRQSIGTRKRPRAIETNDNSTQAQQFPHVNDVLHLVPTRLLREFVNHRLEDEYVVTVNNIRTSLKTGLIRVQ